VFHLAHIAHKYLLAQSVLQTLGFLMLLVRQCALTECIMRQMEVAQVVKHHAIPVYL